ncbi:hypothetical protein B6264_30205 (plasmid) [Kitasatospora aureofaciens]|nr:hypothetical protein B6264_30205 [Kitasatospora aureofaciens]
MLGGVGDQLVEGPVVDEGEDQAGVRDEPGGQFLVSERRVAVVDAGVEAPAPSVAEHRFDGLTVGFGPAVGQVADFAGGLEVSDGQQVERAAVLDDVVPGLQQHVLDQLLVGPAGRAGDDDAGRGEDQAQRGDLGSVGEAVELG